MSKLAMGSQPTKTLSTVQAAKILKVTVQTIRRMVRQGLLHPSNRPLPGRIRARAMRFELLDVLAAAKARDAEADPVLVLHTANRAIAIAEATQRCIKQIYAFLGIDLTPLSTEPDEVIALFLQAQQLVREPEIRLPPREVLMWARTFLSVTEGYLTLAEDVTAEPMLWKLYIDLAQRLSDEAPRTRFTYEKDLEAAYGYLEAGRRSLRAAAFFFVRSRRGHDIASRLFPDGRSSLDESIISLLFPH